MDSISPQRKRLNVPFLTQIEQIISESREKTNSSYSDRGIACVCVYRTSVCVCVFEPSLLSLIASRGGGMASPQVIRVGELCQSARCTPRRTSWPPGCVRRDCLMRYWLPIESMDFWFSAMEVGRRGKVQSGEERRGNWRDEQRNIPSFSGLWEWELWNKNDCNDYY